MDPIEKLLSDLAPAHASGSLDQTMARLFDRADRKARVRRAAMSFGTMAIMLAIGLAAGYHLGANAMPAAPVTYIIPMTSETTGFFSEPDPATARASVFSPSERSGSMAVTIVRKDTV